MDGLTLMIADNSDEFRQALDEALSDSYKIVHCRNGKQALQTALEIKPEIIILDLMLTELDGVSLLHEIRDAGIYPMVLAVTRFYNDYIQETAQDLGIGYIIRKPCDPAAVAGRLRDLTNRIKPKAVRPVDPRNYVMEQTRMLMFSPPSSGNKIYPGSHFNCTGGAGHLPDKRAISPAWASLRRHGLAGGALAAHRHCGRLQEKQRQGVG